MQTNLLKWQVFWQSHSFFRLQAYQYLWVSDTENKAVQLNKLHK